MFYKIITYVAIAVFVASFVKMAMGLFIVAVLMAMDFLMAKKTISHEFICSS